MFTGPVGPVEVFFYWPETDLGNFYWPGAIGSPLASSPVRKNIRSYFSFILIVLKISPVRELSPQKPGSSGCCNVFVVVVVKKSVILPVVA